MDWIFAFDLFLFDFDGLLVDTERVHYQAYIDVLQHRGILCDWSFHEFCSYAHYDGQSLKNALCEAFPLTSGWDHFYQEKKARYFELLEHGKVQFLPGAYELISALDEAGILSCVVTNSSKEQTDYLKEQLPTLKKIPHWITREMYQKPKPDPECYQQAIVKFARKDDRIVGFEDSLRGLTALRQTKALPILICPKDHPLLNSIQDVLHFPSLASVGQLS